MNVSINKIETFRNSCTTTLHYYNGWINTLYNELKKLEENYRKLK